MKHLWSLLNADAQRLVLAASLAMVAHGVAFTALEMIVLEAPGEESLQESAQTSISVALRQEIVAQEAATLADTVAAPDSNVQQSFQNDSFLELLDEVHPPIEDDVAGSTGSPPPIEPLPTSPESEKKTSSRQNRSAADAGADTLDPNIDQNADPALSEATEQRVSLSPTRYIPPSYPEAARLGGTEGEVHLRFTIDRRGRPAEIILEQTSGSTLLDQEALRTARLWRFPRDYAGRETVHRIVFRLE